MTTYYNGLIYDKISDYAAVESLLGLDDDTLTEVIWSVSVSTYGKNAPQTFNDPAEFEEIDDIQVDSVEIGTETGYLVATKEQIELLEKYRPTDDELYWNIITNARVDK